MKDFKAALFDLDGVVFDTEPQYTVFWGAQCREFHPEHPGLEHEIKGQTLVQIYDAWFSGPLTEKQPLITERLNRYEQQMDYNYVAGFEAFIKKSPVPQVDQYVHILRIKLFSATLLQLAEDIVAAAGFTVNPVGIHRIKGVRNTDNPGFLRNLLSAQPARITFAIVSFMVTQGYISRRFNRCALSENFSARRCVGFDNSKFDIRQSGRLIDHLIRHADLTNVMQKSHDVNV